MNLAKFAEARRHIRDRLERGEITAAAHQRQSRVIEKAELRELRARMQRTREREARYRARVRLKKALRQSLAEASPSS